MRSQIGVPTTFNFLGPLANPARVQRQMVGVGDPGDGRSGSRPTLVELGSIRAMVFFGHDGLDELTTVDSSTVLTVEDGTVAQQTLDPTELGLARATPEDLRGGDAAHNAKIVRARARRARPGRAATSCCSTPRRRCRWPAPPTRGSRGSSSPPPRSTTAAPPRCSSSGSRCRNDARGGVH